MTSAWVLRRVWRQLRRRPAHGVALVLAFALLGVLAGGARVVSVRAGDLLPRLSGGVHVIAYLVDEVDEERVVELVGLLRRVPGVEEVERVDEAEALARLRAHAGTLPGVGGVLDGVEEGFLPRSLEVRLRGGRELPARAQALAAQLRGLDGVLAVDAMIEGTERLSTLARLLRGVGWALCTLALAVGAALIVLALGRGRPARRREAQVLALLGATRAGLRAPALVRAGAAALAGALVALALLVAGQLAIDALVGSVAGALELAVQATEPSDATLVRGVPLPLRELALGGLGLVALGALLGFLEAPVVGAPEPEHG